VSEKPDDFTSEVTNLKLSERLSSLTNCNIVQHQLSGTHCLLLLGLLIAWVLLGLDLKLTYSPKPMPPSVSVTQRL